MPSLSIATVPPPSLQTFLPLEARRLARVKPAPLSRCSFLLRLQRLVAPIGSCSLLSPLSDNRLKRVYYPRPRRVRHQTSPTTSQSALDWLRVLYCKRYSTPLPTTKRRRRRHRRSRPLRIVWSAMKAARASCEGYLTFRTSPSSPPPMLRRYCFLVGTSFHYYR